jgi:hypothetical protein
MFNRRKILALLGVAVIAAVLSLVSTQGAYAAAPLGPFLIETPHGECIQTNPANNGPDIQVVQEPCNVNVDTQKWYFWWLGGQDWHIQNVATHNCLRALSNNDFAAVDTIDCTNISNERFTVADLAFTAGPHQVIARVGGGNRCLDVFDDSSVPGNRIDIFHCTANNDAQVFFMPFVGPI